MENSEFEKRLEDLARRCKKSCDITLTGFLSPAERAAAELWARRSPDCNMLFHGGDEHCERTVAFFLPYYMEQESFSPEEFIKAIHLTAHFASPAHRDYMGALLGMGIGREWLGDIRVIENEAYIFCLPSVHRHLMSIDKVGRVGVKAADMPLSQIPAPQRQVKNVSFSVMSMRLDAVAAGMFSLSRTECARHIGAGSVSLNHLQCLKPDTPVKEGDIISLRGSGKGCITGTGGTSRKGRQFVYAEIYK